MKLKTKKHPNNITTADIERAAGKAGMNIYNGGKHGKIEDPRTGEAMTYCQRPMGLGLKMKVIKWLLLRGAVLSAALVVAERLGII